MCWNGKRDEKSGLQHYEGDLRIVGDGGRGRGMGHIAIGIQDTTQMLASADGRDGEIMSREAVSRRHCRVISINSCLGGILKEDASNSTRDGYQLMLVVVALVVKHHTRS